MPMPSNRPPSMGVNPDPVTGKGLFESGKIFKPPAQIYKNLTELLEKSVIPGEAGYDASIEGKAAHYRVTLGRLGEGLKIEVLSEKKTDSPTTLTLLPNGQIQNSSDPDPHSPTREERNHLNVIQTIFGKRADLIETGKAFYALLEGKLQRLRGRFEVEQNSVWYDYHVVRDKTIYTFRRLAESFAKPEFNQIAIFADSISNSGAKRELLFTLSENGEINYAYPTTRTPLEINLRVPGRVPQIPTSDQIHLLEFVIHKLNGAIANPGRYRDSLVKRLASIEEATFSPPEIELSVLPSSTTNTTHGPLGEPIVTMRHGKDLLWNLLPGVGHELMPPNPTVESTRRLVPRWRQRFWIGLELARWSKAWAFNQLGFINQRGQENAEARGDMLRLHLFPDGGGRLDIFRNHQLHDIFIGTKEGSMWRARAEIRRKYGRVADETPRDQLDEVLAAREAGQGVYSPFRVEEPPKIKLSILNHEEFTEGKIASDPAKYLRSGKGVVKIEDAAAAWQQIQKQIPEGVEFRVRASDTNQSWHKVLLSPIGKINQIHVDFPNSSLPLQLDIRDYKVFSSQEKKEVSRVEIVMRHGPNHEAVVYKDGLIRPDLAMDVSQHLEQRARASLRTNRLAAALRTPSRIYYYYKTSGMTYALSYFATLPLILGYEQAIMTPEERKLAGTPVPHLSPKYFWHDFCVPFMTLSTASGASGVIIDGVFNMVPGLKRTWMNWVYTRTSLAESYRLAKTAFFNPSPFVRPIAMNAAKGFLQRAVPLFVGMSALERLQTGHYTSPKLWRNFRDTAIVSTASSGLLGLFYRSAGISKRCIQAGLLEAAGAGASEFSLTLTGGVVIAGLELLALGIIGAHERKAELTNMEDKLREDLAAAIDRRNEVVTRLQHGEELTTREFKSADAEFQQTYGIYRHFLEMREKRQGTGHLKALTMANDFEDAFFMSKISTWTGATLNQSLHELRERRHEMERKVSNLYADHGVRLPELSRDKEESLRDYLARADNAIQVTSPIALDSREGQAIIAQFRWKNRQDPHFLHWSTEQKAEYILEQFGGFRSGNRLWNQQEALAFVHQLEENSEWLRMELVQPDEQKISDPRFKEMTEAEQQIRLKERLSHVHIATHVQNLADNTEDLDQQVEDYLHRSNALMSSALEKFLPQTTPFASLQVSDEATPPVSVFEANFLN